MEIGVIPNKGGSYPRIQLIILREIINKRIVSIFDLNELIKKDSKRSADINIMKAFRSLQAKGFNIRFIRLGKISYYSIDDRELKNDGLEIIYLRKELKEMKELLKENKINSFITYVKKKGLKNKELINKTKMEMDEIWK